MSTKDFVDLGLPSGTLWAKCNLGAEKETDFGLFYQWGDTQGYVGVNEHQFKWNDYKWENSDNITKYNKTDNKLVLDNEDDPVFVATNGKFKTPTQEQLQELMNHTDNEWVENFEGSGVNGMKFWKKDTEEPTDGDSYIFIPAAGNCYVGGHHGVGSWGYVWSDSRYESSAYGAWYMHFYAGDFYMNVYSRCNGYSVRGVVNIKKINKKMTNNFSLIEEYMKEQGLPLQQKDSGDSFFVVMLLRRGKDHPNLSAANYTFKNYYIDSIEKLQKVKTEIITCCDMFGLRAYVSVNLKSKEAFTKNCALAFSQNIVNNDYKKPWSIVSHVFGKLGSKSQDRWVVDVDEVDTVLDKQVSLITQQIRKCESKYSDPIITAVKTRSGLHIITHPFNLQKFNQYCQEERIIAPDVHKNHITLLYEDIDSFFLIN